MGWTVNEIRLGMPKWKYLKKYDAPIKFIITLSFENHSGKYRDFDHINQTAKAYTGGAL